MVLEVLLVEVALNKTITTYSSVAPGAPILAFIFMDDFIFICRLSRFLKVFLINSVHL